MKRLASDERRETTSYRQDQHIPHLMHRAAASMFAAFSADFPPEITVSMWRVLAALLVHGEQRQVDLAKLTVSEASTISRAVSVLKKKRLVSRVRSDADNREVVINLTAKGRAVAEKFIPVTLAHEAAITRGMTAAEVTVLRRCLARIAANMESLPARPDRRRKPVRRGQAPVRE